MEPSDDGLWMRESLLPDTSCQQQRSAERETLLVSGTGGGLCFQRRLEICTRGVAARGGLRCSFFGCQGASICVRVCACAWACVGAGWVWIGWPWWPWWPPAGQCRCHWAAGRLVTRPLFRKQSVGRIRGNGEEPRKLAVSSSCPVGGLFQVATKQAQTCPDEDHDDLEHRTRLQSTSAPPPPAASTSYADMLTCRHIRPPIRAVFHRAPIQPTADDESTYGRTVCTEQTSQSIWEVFFLFVLRQIALGGQRLLLSWPLRR